MMNFTHEKISLKKINFSNKKYKIIDAFYEDIFFTPILFLDGDEFIILSGHTFLEEKRKDIDKEVTPKNLDRISFLFPKRVKEFNIIEEALALNCIKTVLEEKRKENEIWANVIDKEVTPKNLVKISILSQKMIKEFNIIEEALGLNLVKSVSSEEDYVKNAEEILGKKYNLSIINDIVSILSLDENIQTAILSGLIYFKMGSYLNEFKQDEITYFLNFFENLQLSFSNQKKFLRLVQEIAKIKDSSLLSCLEPIKNIVSMDLNINKKQSEVFKKLLNLRYPEMTKAQKKIEESVKKLNLPSFINFKYPLDFEALEFELLFKFKNREELLKRGEAIKDIIKLKEWDEVLIKA